MFDHQNYSNITIAGGCTVNQFNPEEPISKLINSISSLYFEDNYMKLYNNEYVQINYGRHVANGIYLDGNLDYQQRKPLFNNTNLVWIKHEDNYTSNNPLLPYDYVTPAFYTHHITKASIFGKINF